MFSSRTKTKVCSPAAVEEEPGTGEQPEPSPLQPAAEKIIKGKKASDQVAKILRKGKVGGGQR